MKHPERITVETGEAEMTVWVWKRVLVIMFTLIIVGMVSRVILEML